MKRIFLEDLENVKEFQNLHYYGGFETSFDLSEYYIDPLRKGSKEFFSNVYKTFDGEKGTQHALLMTELGELNCAFIDLKNSHNILFDDNIDLDINLFANEDNVSQDAFRVGLELYNENHIREEIADVLMLLYQFSILNDVDYKVKFKDAKNINLKDLDINIIMQELIYNISRFDHQLNRKQRQRVDFSDAKLVEYLQKSIGFANLMGYYMDSLDKIKPVSKYEFVENDEAKSVQDWFDYKVERTGKRMEEELNNPKKEN